MFSDINNPVKEPSMMYPSIGNLKPGKKYFICPKCHGNMNTRIKVEIQKFEELIFGFQCYSCGKKWFISSKLVLNTIFEDELQRMMRYTKSTGKEFGGLIIKTKKGLRIDMVEVGDETSVSFNQSHPLNEGEEVVGTVHNHPYTDYPSLWDIYTFLNSKWEKVSIINGASNLINVLIKTKDTVKPLNQEEFLKTNNELNVSKTGDIYQFRVFRGKINNLQLINNIGRDLPPVSSIEQLLTRL